MNVEPALIINLLSLAVSMVTAVFVIIGFFWRFATKEDIKRLDTRIGNVETRLGAVETRLGQVETRVGNLETRMGHLESRMGHLETRMDRLEDKFAVVENKADASLELHHAVRGDLKVLAASVIRIEGYFETPKLKTS